VEDKDVAPGETGKIKVVFDSKRYSGKVSKKVFVYTNAVENKGIASFVLKGMVKRELLVKPVRLQFGRMAPGEKREAFATLTSNAEETIHFSSIEISHKDVEAVLPADEIKPGETLRIPVTVHGRTEDRLLNGFILIKTDSKQTPYIRYVVYASVLPDDKVPGADKKKKK